MVLGKLDAVAEELPEGHTWTQRRIATKKLPEGKFRNCLKADKPEQIYRIAANELPETDTLAPWETCKELLLR